MIALAINLSINFVASTIRLKTYLALQYWHVLLFQTI